ncbi:MAG: hypothetical protein AAF591_23370 [Verrucomicrobiota bacterium]
MNYEELKCVWDSQNEEPVFALNHQALLKTVERQADSIARYVKLFEISMILVAFAVAVILPIDAWREGDGSHQYFIGAICLAAGVYAWLGRQNRRRREIEFDESIRGVIEKSLAQIEYHEKRQIMYLWLFHLPILLAAGVGLTLYSNTRIPWIWGGVIVVCVVSYWGTQRDIKRNLRPQKRNLKVLREKLGGIESQIT